MTGERSGINDQKRKFYELKRPYGSYTGVVRHREIRGTELEASFLLGLWECAAQAAGRVKASAVFQAMNLTIRNTNLQGKMCRPVQQCHGWLRGR